MTPTTAGLTLIPFTVGIMSGSILTGQLTARTGRYKIFPVIGTVLMGIGALLFSRLSVDTTLLVVFADSLVFGLGLGFTMQPLVLAVQNAVHVKDMGPPPANEMRDVGKGVIDWRGTLGAAKRAGVTHFFVEHDEPADPVRSIRASIDYLARLDL